MGRTTAADKKKMLLKIYHTKKEPFNLKELTKLAKAAGLAEKLVQDVNTQLMDANFERQFHQPFPEFYEVQPRVTKSQHHIRVELDLHMEFQIGDKVGVVPRNTDVQMLEFFGEGLLENMEGTL